MNKKCAKEAKGKEIGSENWYLYRERKRKMMMMIRIIGCMMMEFCKETIKGDAMEDISFSSFLSF